LVVFITLDLNIVTDKGLGMTQKNQTQLTDNSQISNPTSGAVTGNYLYPSFYEGNNNGEFIRKIVENNSKNYLKSWHLLKFMYLLGKILF
jgi:hypothetical protein